MSLISYHLAILPRQYAQQMFGALFADSARVCHFNGTMFTLLLPGAITTSKFWRSITYGEKQFHTPV